MAVFNVFSPKKPKYQASGYGSQYAGNAYTQSPLQQPQSVSASATIKPKIQQTQYAMPTQPKASTQNYSMASGMDTRYGSNPTNYVAPPPKPAPAPNPGQSYLQEAQKMGSERQRFVQSQLPQQQDFIKKQYGIANQGLQNQMGEAEATFNQFKGDTEAGVKDLLASGERQKSNARDYYGEAQRLAAQTRNETRGQTQRTFANLGTIDSRGEGSFQQATENTDSAFNSFTQGNLKAQADKFAQIDETVATAERSARSAILTKQQELVGLKKQIQLAMAQNDLDQAKELTQAYNDTQELIYQIEDSVSQLKYAHSLESQRLQSAIAEMEAKSVYGDPEQTAKNESSLRGEFFNRTKDNKYNEVFQAYQKINNAPETAAGDMGMVFAYMKLLDPSSTVREGEYANAQNATGVPAQIINQYNKVVSGQRLNPGQRQEFKTAAQSYALPVIQQQQEAMDFYSNLARQQGVNPANVTGGYSPIDMNQFLGQSNSTQIGRFQVSY